MAAVMRRLSGAALWPALLMLAAVAITPAAAAEPHGGRSGAIAVEMTGFRSDRGRALVALYRSARGFPDRPQHAVRRVQVSIRQRKARAVLRGLRPGDYAIAVLHDEDGDRAMKTGFLGRPQEGYGASRDARGRFGPPKFDDARIALPPGRTLVAAIRMTYP
jgi:uncharacterized protein (DUF2141 family)